MTESTVIQMKQTDIEKIEAWLAATNTTEGRLGLLAAANPRAVARIRTGTAYAATLSAVLKYIRAHPPRD